jgi:hypothetical protein
MAVPAADFLRSRRMMPWSVTFQRVIALLAAEVISAGKTNQNIGTGPAVIQ